MSCVKGEEICALFEGSRDAIYLTTVEGEIIDATNLCWIYRIWQEEIIGLNAGRTYVHPEIGEYFRSR